MLPEHEPELGKPRIRLLGRLLINGYATGEKGTPWKYRKAAEMIAWLACHPDGGTPDTLMEALWPGEPGDASRLHLVACDARRAVGPNGGRWLPHAGPADPRYRLDADVDVEFFRRLVDTAPPDDPEPGPRIEALNEALDLVDGRPFDLPYGGYRWASIDEAETIARVAATALESAALAARVEDWETAMWACRRGYRADPYSTDLVVAHGRAALAAADAGGIAWTFAVLDEIDDPGMVPADLAAARP